MNTAYDRAKRDMRSISRELDEYLERQKKRLGCRVRGRMGEGGWESGEYV